MVVDIFNSRMHLGSFFKLCGLLTAANNLIRKPHEFRLR